MHKLAEIINLNHFYECKYASIIYLCHNIFVEGSHWLKEMYYYVLYILMHADLMQRAASNQQEINELIKVTI